MRAMRERTARQSVEKPRETREWAAKRRGKAHAKRANGQRGEATRRAPREARESEAKRRRTTRKTPRSTRKRGEAGRGKAPAGRANGRWRGARKIPLETTRMGGGRKSHAKRAIGARQRGKPPRKRAGGRRSAESPSAKRANGWKKPPPAKCAEEGERMCVYAFSDAARSCASGSLRLLTALQACMTRATAMTP